MLQHAAERPQAPALREKEYGIWQTTSWGELAQLVRDLAGGLAAAGLARGQHPLHVRHHVQHGLALPARDRVGPETAVGLSAPDADLEVGHGVGEG